MCARNWGAADLSRPPHGVRTAILIIVVFSRTFRPPVSLSFCMVVVPIRNTFPSASDELNAETQSRRDAGVIRIFQVPAFLHLCGFASLRLFRLHPHWLRRKLRWVIRGQILASTYKKSCRNCVVPGDSTAESQA